MILDKVIRNSGATPTYGNTRVEIDSICSDSRKVAAGALFVAVKGFASDGHDYISLAISKGARAIIYEDQEALD